MATRIVVPHARVSAVDGSVTRLLDAFARVPVAAVISRAEELPRALASQVPAVFFLRPPAFHLGPLTMEFIQGAPVFAVEVRSKSDYGPVAERRMAAKRADYFAAGTQVVWDVDLLGADVVRVHRASDPDRPRVYRRGERAEAEPALPDWSIPVDELFP